MHSNVFSSVFNIRTTALLLIGASLIATSSAMTLREFRTLEKTGRQGTDYANYYLVGVMEGVLESHARNARNGAIPRICRTGRRPDPRIARSLFDTELKRNEGLYEADMSVQLVMINALTAAYTCSG